jgi:hypothetical protein
MCREEACRCVGEIIGKGMSPKDKVALIDTLQLLERISQLTMHADSDEDFLEELAGMWGRGVHLEGALFTHLSKGCKYAGDREDSMG